MPEESNNSFTDPIVQIEPKFTNCHRQLDEIRRLITDDICANIAALCYTGPRDTFLEIIMPETQDVTPAPSWPFLTTVTPRSLTLASNEITLPSFHISKVTVSRGRLATKTGPRAA
ncbi:hypothetical protein ACVIYL_009034 [Bradyrhizobium sp. USDA 3315]